jgi:hypothetical protein
MKKNLLLRSVAALGLLCAAQSASAQGAIVNGGTYKFTHYGVVADASAAAFGVPAGTPLCMDIDEGKSVAGTSVGQWGDNGFEAAQRYILEKQTDGSYKIKLFNAQMYLQPVGLATVKETRIEVAAPSASDAQRWLISDPNNNGRYEFKLKGTNQVLEVGGASAAPGARVNLYDDTDFEPAQRWVLTLTSTATASKSANSLALQLNTFPNPLAYGQHARLSVAASTSGLATVEVLDMLGNKVHAQRTSLRAGDNTVGLTNSQLAAGVYLVRVSQGGFIQQTRMVQQ